jgi:heterodisulfide reductase subunit C
MSAGAALTPVRTDSAAYKLGTTYPDVPYEEKERLFEEIKADERYADYLYGCYDCGICVAACPSARYYDFSPRRIASS